MKDFIKYQEVISEIENNDLLDISLRDKYIRLKKILERMCKDVVQQESLQFSSLFSRLVFLSQKYNIPRSLEWNLQSIRVRCAFLQKDEQNVVSQHQYFAARESIKLFISAVYGDFKESDIVCFENEDTDIFRQELDCIRVQVIDIDVEKQIITGKTNGVSDLVIYVRYNVKNVNDIFNSTIEKLWIGAQINLIDNRLDESGNYVPKSIVLEPDYLIDASSMAECFQNYGRSHLHYFRRKFETVKNTQYILLGNLANFFLDELVSSDNSDLLFFNDVFLESFRQKPFEYTSCTDIWKPEDFKTFMVKAQTQFENIKRVVIHDFPKNNINLNHCFLEPSFYCEKYGFQGRLDLLQLSDNENKQHKIVELKSGGLPFPKEDAGKIAINHEVQTTIYRLIIQSVFGVDDRRISASILYSASENAGENLRLSATYRTLEKEIINVRNLIVATEHTLYTGEQGDVDKLFSDIFNLDNYGRVPDFFKDQIVDLEKTINNITTLERKYFYRYITFISRELYLQKAGDDFFESASSTASLWNTEFEDRRNAFDLISDLEIISIDESGRDMKILFRRNDLSEFANFREGEICILYPHDNVNDTVLDNQIMKGTVAEISAENLLLRFRYKQKNKTFFQKYRLWVVEHDRLDHSYNNMYKNLFAFLLAPIRKRRLLLGLEEPLSSATHSADIENKESSVLIKTQNTIVNKAIAAQDYFLIVGPPGTGKTSVFARRLIEYYYNNTQDNILIIAYTNRAVDELCASINQAFGCKENECGKYIRIGTELSCGKNYRHRLLQNISSSVKSRGELRNTMKEHRIFIGTLAAITGKPEIFDIKDFNIAIIDEASQILESQIIGILPKVDKFIMIGDHKQLSTIVLQDKEKAGVDDSELNIIELYNCSESLFERLFRMCKKMGWTNAYDTLIYQGRMHLQLAEFANAYFYDNILKPIDVWQTQSLTRIFDKSYDAYQKLVSRERMAFIPCVEYKTSHVNDKINYKEADIAVSLSKAIFEIYKANGLEFDSEKTLGIITPYRNQIALIKHKLREANIPELSNIMVDTVERFQGSQREVIILSFCMNKSYQLSFFSNLNNDGSVDRKLNVAMTRARQQLFLIGNEYILNQNYLYRKLLDSIFYFKA